MIKESIWWSHLVYASYSFGYGTNKKIPYSTDDKVDNQEAGARYCEESVNTEIGGIC